MYVGFEVDGENLSDLCSGDCEYYRKIATSFYKICKEKIERKISRNIIIQNGEIEVKPLENSWFPKIKSHVFLSHSHADKDLALALAGYLKCICDIDVFIDSCIWEYCDDLLKILDKKLCKMESGNFNYKRRNITTAQVHLILNMALAKMINLTECFMFLKTENSVYMRDGISSYETDSPWICDELLISSLIARRSKIIHRQEYKLNHSISINESLHPFPKFVYDLSFMKMKSLSCSDLLYIANNVNEIYSGDSKVNLAEQFLDMLYDEMGIIDTEAVLNG